MSQSSLLVTGPGAPARAAGPRRRRRPSGEPPPLPYSLGRSGRQWARLGGGVLLVWLLIVVTPFGALVDRFDHFLLEGIVSIRSPRLTTVAHALEPLGSPARLLVLQWVVIVVALAFRRFRHLVAFIACLVLTTWVGSFVAVTFHRPRPDTV